MDFDFIARISYPMVEILKDSAPILSLIIPRLFSKDTLFDRFFFNRSEHMAW